MKQIGQVLVTIDELSVSERILLAELLWDSVRAEVNASELSNSQREVLSLRFAYFELEPDQGEPWDSVKTLWSDV